MGHFHCIVCLNTSIMIKGMFYLQNLTTFLPLTT